MVKVLILGNYGAKNFGDELVLKGILKMIKGDITVLSSNPTETKRLHNVNAAWVFPTGLRSLLRGSIFKTIKHYWQADLILFGGGTLFTDEEPRTIWISGIQILPAILMRKDIICFRQGIGPIRRKRIVRWLFNRFAKISVRDEQSARELKKLGIKKEIHVKPDPAFSLNAKKSHGNELLVSIRDWPTLDPNFEQKFTELLKWTKMPVRILIFGEEDRKISERIARKVDAKIDTITLSNYEKIFAKGKFSLCFRLHACILSIMHEIPCIGFAYESKIENLFKKHDLEKYVINIENIDVDLLKEKFSHARNC